jgi:mutual gliding-motility protein MglA
MAFFNYATMQMAAKIVYYGPGLCGKTTNLQYIYNKTSNQSRGEMVSLETETDRTLFFDLLPLEVGVIAGFKTRFQLYTVPGQVFYGETRKMVLRGVDGIVFVADSQQALKESNLESLKDLHNNLKGLGLDIRVVPMVFQYNKRDLQNLMTIDEMQKLLNPFGYPYFEGIAIKGAGVFDTLKGISRITLQILTEKLIKPGEKSPVKITETPKAAPQQSAQPAPSIPSPVVEFATETTKMPEEVLAQTTPKIKTITSSSARVSNELDHIRERLLGPLVVPSQKPKVKDLISPALEDLKRFAVQTPPPAPVKATEPINIDFSPEALSRLESVFITVEILTGKRTFKEKIKVHENSIRKQGDTIELDLVVRSRKA